MTLRATFGKQYRVALDPAADGYSDPALHTIPTRTGEVYVHSDSHAGVEVGRRFRSVHARLAGYPIHVRCDELTTYLVPWADLAEVLPWLRPWKRRQVSETERQRLAELSQKHSPFRHSTITGAAQPALESHAAPSLDPEAV
jgi:hypothetical protein